MSKKSTAGHALFRCRLVRPQILKYRDDALLPVPLVATRPSAQTTINNLLPKDQIPPRPKPPVPAEFFIHLKRSWRSMSKEAVRAHVVDRFAVREKYLAAYGAWETLHDKWAFGIYQLMRTVVKSQERMALQRRVQVDMEVNGDTNMDDDVETVLDDDVQDRASQVATEFDDYAAFEDSDMDGSALTILQDDAEADEQDRVRRWFVSLHKRSDLPESPEKPTFTPLRRAGPRGVFGMGVECESSSRKRPRAWRTPSIDLPEKSGRALPVSRSGDARPDITTTPSSGMPLDDEDDCAMSDTPASESDDDDAEDSHPWRIYSDKCSCGYAGCYCRLWARWWDKTLDMLDYVEYVDVPVHSGSGDLTGASPRFARLCPGEEPLPAGYERSSAAIEKAGEAATGKRGWVYDRFAPSKRHVKARYAHVVGPDPRYLDPVWMRKPQLGREHPPSLSGPAGSGSGRSDSDDSDYIQSESEETNGSTEGDHLTDDDLDISADKEDGVQRIRLLEEQTTRIVPDRQISPEHADYPAMRMKWEEFLEDNPMIPSEYSPEIFRVLIDELEPNCMPDPILSHKCLNWRTREHFVHWVAYVHYCCNLAPEILFRAINLMDRYLAKSDYPPQGAQWDSLAAACLWSSWKFDGAGYPIVPLETILNYIQPGMISRTDVIFAEWTLHRILEHDLSFPGPLVFMRRALMAFESTKEVAYLARFFVEIALTAKSMMLCRPSGTAAAAVWLARELIGIPTWNLEMEVATTWKAHSLYLPMSYIISTILEIPPVLKDWHDCTIFYKWTEPCVNNLARWCQDALQRVWPKVDVDIERDILRLRELVQSQTIPPLCKIQPGPLPDNPLFEQ